jgi:hypothetical protein
MDRDSGGTPPSPLARAVPHASDSVKTAEAQLARPRRTGQEPRDGGGASAPHDLADLRA